MIKKIEIEGIHMEVGDDLKSTSPRRSASSTNTYPGTTAKVYGQTLS